MDNWNWKTYRAPVWAHLVWVNACHRNLRLQSSLDSVEWKELIELIDEEFAKLGRSLTNDKKIFLRNKLFRGNVPADEMVTREQFCGKPCACIPSSSISATTPTQPEETQIPYGEWLFHCINLLNADKSLGRMWAAGKILGFISSEQIANILSRCPKSISKETFIIRFPENRPGNIGLYFYREEAINDLNLIKYIYTMRDLQIISLADRIIYCPIATMLYSDFQVQPIVNIVEKNLAFPKAEASN